MSSAIVVQCFVKPDTLGELCTSLARCAGSEDYHLIFWSDVPGFGARSEHYAIRNRDVREVVETFARDHGHRFASVTFHRNETNLGTCATCQAALDHAFSLHAFVIFTEDDTIFAADALLWFGSLAGLNVLDEPNILALAGESIYFDSRTRPVSDAHRAKARAVAGARLLVADYVRLNFVPSTCFATTREKWRQFGTLRGQPRGDEDVCHLCKQQGFYAIFPVVARVKDVGMLHEDGYSVRVLGKQHVPEVKNTYLMSDDLPPCTGTPRPFSGNMGRLFEESVELHPFEEPAPAIRSGIRPWKLWCFSLRNYGDALTPYILRRYNVPFELVGRFEDANLLGIGSNLDRVRRDNPPIVVWSAGFMYPKDRPVPYGADVRFLGVRGRNTAALIDPVCSGELVLGDGGMLIGDLYPYDQAAKTYELGIMPHMSDVRAVVGLGLATWPGTKVIDVLAPLEQVLHDIASCRRLLSSSLHGIVTADAFGLPSAYAVFANGRDVEGDGFKYADYSSVIGYDITRIDVGPGITHAGVIDTIDRLPVRPVPQAALRKDLEMTLHVLRAGALGLCAI